MSGGGGKGGSNTQKTEIPKWIEEPAKRNLARAEDAQKIGYMPYYGPDVAAFNPTQQAAMQANIGAGQAFGLLPQGNIDPLAGMPSTVTSGGLTGYSAAPLYEQAVAEARAKQPTFAERYDALYKG